MIKAGDIISYQEMCSEEKVSLQKGMNFRCKNGNTIILMSLRKNAPYADRIEEDGKILIYEGHDMAKYQGLKQDPKKIDQPKYLPSGQLSENRKLCKNENHDRTCASSKNVIFYESNSIRS